MTKSGIKTDAAVSDAPACEICNLGKCGCSRFVCPVHGTVKAKPDDGKFACPVSGCKITRTKNELEFP